MLDNAAHVLQGDALAAHGGDNEQLDEVGEGVEPDGGPTIELALDGGNDESGLVPVAHLAKRRACEPRCALDRQRE